MWTFFKTLFNILRNISLAIVLAVVGCFAWIWTDEEAKQEFVAAFNEEIVIAEKIEQDEVENLEEEEDDDRFIFEEEDFVDEGDEGFGIQAIEESSPREKTKKIKLDVKGGIARLRPSQIMYVLSGSPSELTKIDERKIYLKRDIALKDVFSKLTEYEDEYFFRVNTAIINCHYIEQLIQESSIYKNKYQYEHFVVMEDDKRIKIPKLKVDSLRHMLDEL